jgi:CMP-N-acetylneuraminic acid synthetase
MKIVAFIPIKFNSERLKNKNFLNLGNKPLCFYIFNTLLKIKLIDEIYVFCSNKDIINYMPNKIKFLKRDTNLDQNDTLGMDIYQSFISKVNADIYLLSHVTSPFISKESIEEGIKAILYNNFDSSCSCKEVKTFAWFEDKPLNYNLNNIPRTQNIKPVLFETSAFYIFKKNIIEDKKRISNNHYFVKTNCIESIDIDTEEDYNLAKRIIEHNN